MNRLRMICVLLLVAAAGFAMDYGAGIDFALSRETSMSGADDNPTVDLETAADAVLIVLVDESTEISPFVGFASSRLSDEDLAEPVIDSQLGLRIGTGYYVRLIRGQHVTFSFGPRLAITNYFARSSQVYDRYANIDVDVDAILNMDLSPGDGWLLRFGVPTMYLSYTYEREDEDVQTLLTVGSQLFAGGAVISLRKMF